MKKLYIWILLLLLLQCCCYCTSTTRTTTSSTLNVTQLDCMMRIFAATQYAQYIQPPFRRRSSSSSHNTNNHNHNDNDDYDSSTNIVFQQIKDALQIQLLCPDLDLDLDSDYTDDHNENDLFYKSLQRMKQQQHVQQQQKQPIQQQSFTTTTTSSSRRRMIQRHQEEEEESQTRSILTTTTSCMTQFCIYVYCNSSSSNNSSNNQQATTNSIPIPITTTTINYEVPYIDTALWISRFIIQNPYNTTIIFRTGIHSIGGNDGSLSPIQLNTIDNGITIIGEPNTYLSGAIALPRNSSLWTTTTTTTNVTPASTTGSNNNSKEQQDVLQQQQQQQQQLHAIYVINLTDYFISMGISNDSIPKVVSLFGINQRYIRARYPNSNPEIDLWGYNSPNRLVYSIPADIVIEWHKPQRNNKNIPNFTYIDLRYNHDNPNRPIKNDSTMEMYNVYTTGTGGVCNTVWDNDTSDSSTTDPSSSSSSLSSSSYWCSNSSAGGWAEVDFGAATSGQLNIPIGMTYNQSTNIGQYMNQWNTSQIPGGIIHAWHSQSWAMHMFQIKAMNGNNNNNDTNDTNNNGGGTFVFENGGGRQGGRNWCRCDQCSYAALWCGQHQNPRNNSDTRLISGTWYIENILPELDIPGEFYFDHTTNLLYIIPNVTTTTTTTNTTPKDDQYQQSSTVEDENVKSNSIDDNNNSNIPYLRFSMLDQLIRITDGAQDITISNLGFRDTSSTYMSTWSVPSGGDWSIHRGGSIYIENANYINIHNCTFSRLDGNAIFISQQTRNITISRNTFEWIGESAIALWGHTDDYNATRRILPMYTVIKENVMREIGIYQKQSSGVFISKAMFTTIQNNIMFNIARAAINFNDMVGGGDIVEWNLLFNTCRESGDHGPINSWDRQPFLNNARDENIATFIPIRRRIAYNLIFANYGANQAVDNDDGSSWYHVYRNVMYWSTGFKMDYGGHDSIFEDNLVIGYPRKSMCVGFGSFFEGHGHIVRRNYCFASNDNDATIQLETCKNNHAILHDNQYFTPNGNATCLCGYDGPPIPFDKCQELYGIEDRSTVRITPKDPTFIMDIAYEVLFPEDSIH